jgi:AcrR family transcriptional regulator
MMKETEHELNLSPHRQRKYDAMIQDILETARAIMREQGVAALSMQELARRMNMRAPSLYHYFNSKMEIYDALFQMGIRQFTVLRAACARICSIGRESAAQLSYA